MTTPRIALLAVSLAAGSLAPAAAQAGPDYEEPPVFRAADRVAPELLTGDHHRVDDRVVSDGFMNHFSIHSDFGDFEAGSERMLAVRVREVYAIAKLRELSKADAFASALKRAATAPIGAIAQLADRPVETLKGIPAGVARKVRVLYYRGRKTAHEAGKEIKGEDDEPSDDDAEGTGGEQATGEEAAAGAEEGDEATTPVEEGDEKTDEKTEQAAAAAKSAIGYNAAYRELAKSLRVDPYTSNPVLRDELQRLAGAAFAAGLGFKMVVPVPYLIGFTKDVSDLVWDTPRGELERLNNLALRDMGVSKEVRLDFIANDALTATTQTLLVEQLKRLAPLRDRGAFVELAVAAEEEEDGWLIANAARLLASYHAHEEPIAKLVLAEHDELGLAVVGVTAADRVVIPLPFDHVAWQAGMDGAGPLSQLPDRHLWLAGTISPRAQSELEQRGFEIHTRAIAHFERLEAPPAAR